MTTRQLAYELQRKGYRLTIYVRKDGGILITGINGQKFVGAKGNVYARELLGYTLAERRQQQLTKITRERVRHPRKVIIETPQDLERFRKRVMRKWRKAGLTGSISKKNLRKIIEDRGFEGAKTYLEEMQRHAEGKAYNSQVTLLLSRIEEDKQLVYDDDSQLEYLDRAYSLIDEKKEDITPSMVFNMFDSLYDYEKGIISASAFYLNVENLLINL